MACEATTKRDGLGLAYWMHRVDDECDRAFPDFASDRVHDLRVALRRCRSMAEGLGTLDPHPAWKKMRKTGKHVFHQLGALRDVQVMAEWIGQLGPPDDQVTTTLLAYTQSQEQSLKREAATALQMFDRKRWSYWSAILPERSEQTRLTGLAFRHLALERLQEARHLHRQAFRNRTKASLHRVRIGLKKFRYTTESFLPELHRNWEADLKEMQDLLGEVHDLDVLWTVALHLRAFPQEHDRARWHEIVQRERMVRVEKYRARMLGRKSLWQTWGASLPQGGQVQEGALDRLRAWASFLDPDFSHARRVSKLALQMYDGLTSNSHASKTTQNPRTRSILQVAALLHGVGRTKRVEDHHKASHKMIRKLNAPLGWQPAEMQQAGLVARYHCGTLPSSRNKHFASLSQSQRKRAELLAGILRLTDAVDRQYEGKVRNLKVEETGDFITVWADGQLETFLPSEHVAAARCLLETAYERPILIRPAKNSRSMKRRVAQYAR
jgi:CHAD domain-containing protein